MTPEYQGELFQSNKTGRYHWRLRNMRNGRVVAGASGGKDRGYIYKPDAKGMYYEIMGDRWPLEDQT